MTTRCPLKYVYIPCFQPLCSLADCLFTFFFVTLQVGKRVKGGGPIGDWFTSHRTNWIIKHLEAKITDYKQRILMSLRICLGTGGRSDWRFFKNNNMRQTLSWFHTGGRGKRMAIADSRWCCEWGGLQGSCIGCWYLRYRLRLLGTWNFLCR